jgi:hypothetical protein
MMWSYHRPHRRCQYSNAKAALPPHLVILSEAEGPAFFKAAFVPTLEEDVGMRLLERLIER